MRTLTRVNRLRRLVACGLLACYSASCTSWRVQGLSPQQVVTTEHPRSIRVIRSDSTQVVLTQPHVSGDSLTGLTEGKRLSIPLSDIAGLAVPEDDAGKMFALGLLIGAVVAVVVIAFAIGTSGGN